MFERFTGEARDAVLYAADAATGAERIGPDHLLLGAVRVPDSVAARALAQLDVDHARLRTAVRGIPSDELDAEALAGVGIDLDAVRAQVEAEFGPGALDGVGAPTPAGGRKPFDAQAKKMLELALREAVRFRHRRIDTGHLLLAAVRLDDARAAAALDSLGLADADVRDAVTAAWAQTPAARP